MEIEQPYLQVKGEHAERSFNLQGSGSWTIGRSPDNAFIFAEDDAMSRRHAVIQQTQPGTFYLIDLGSSNGSSLNGRRVMTSVELHDGDSILCGETTLVFRKRTEPMIEEVSAAADICTTKVLYQRRLITVLVVDIRGFTQLARQIDEALLAQTMGTWFRELGTLLRRSGCSTDKYIGDAAMGVWVHEGQIPNDEQIRRVLETLIEIQRFTVRLDESFPLPSPVRIGAGINTGLSVISNSGPHGNPDFSPLGDSVNASFRLESATKNTGFDVALGRLTFECLCSTPEVRQYFERQFVELRGYPQPVETWLTSYSLLAEFLRERRKER